MSEILPGIAQKIVRNDLYPPFSNRRYSQKMDLGSSSCEGRWILWGYTFGGQTLFQIEDIPKNGFGIILSCEGRWILWGYFWRSNPFSNRRYSEKWNSDHPHVRVGGFFGFTFGGKTLFQIEDIPKKGFWIIVM